MLTGRRPFNPPTKYLILPTIREGVKLKPKVLRPDLPEAAQEIILKALSYEMEDRYERARDFGELLAQALTTDLELGRETAAQAEQDLELAHVLFLDLVGYSKQPTDRQTQLIAQLQQIVNATEAYQKAKSTNQLISRSTGDGMALAFFSGPKAAVQCAIEIAQQVKTNPQIQLRMGVNSGPVYRTKDINETPDVAGSGINMAQRVMDCGDAGHILLSRSTADMLRELSDWRDSIHDVGTHKVKHKVPVQLFNLCASGVGNPALPQKLRTRRTLRVAAVAVCALIIIGISAVILMRNLGPSQLKANLSVDSAAAAIAEPERDLIYSLTVQRFKDRKPDGPPFQLADANIIFEAKYQVKLNVITPQAGYFYVLNEAAGSNSPGPRYIMLYPAETDKGKGAVTRFQVPEPPDEWIEFDDKRGTEKLWLVWAESPVPELEAVKGLANQQRGEVQEATQSQAIQGLLTKYSGSKSRKELDESAKQTTVKGKGNLLVHPLSLEHR